MSIEVKNRQVNNQFLTDFLANGLVEGKNKSELNFDPRKESEYLQQFFGELRQRQLEVEISTALSELLLSEYSHDYIWNGEKVIDKDTGIIVQNLVKNCDYERKKIIGLEEELIKGKDLIVRVSPKNEELDYPDDMVDFWKKGEGNKLTLMRFKVRMTPSEINGFELMNKDGYCLSDLIQMLNLANSKEGISIKEIEEVTQTLVKRFEKEFGEKIYVDAELITRIFVATRLELEKQDKEKIVLTRSEKKLNIAGIENYLYGRLKITTVAGGGCGSSSISGQFAKEGMIIVKTANGISFRKGSTEGLKYCSKCGCWYIGIKCPICDEIV